MSKIKKNKKKLVTAAVPILTAGAVASAAAYQAGVSFQPKGADRELQVNQVVFPDNKDTTGQDKKKNNDESELWQKNKDSNSDQSPEQNKNADYLFENMQTTANADNTVGVVSDDRNRAQLNENTGTTPDRVYDVSGDGEKGDTVIGVGGQNGGSNGTTGDNNGGNGNGNGSSNTPLPNPGDLPTPDPGNTTRPSDTAKDPDSGKYNPGNMWGGSNKPYIEGIIPNTDTKEDGDNESVVIEQPFGYTDEMMYEGQSVEQKTIFNALQTLVRGKDGSQYLWGADALDNYIRIEAVSFDGGASWISEFPVTIPKGLGEGMMKIRASYRMTLSSENWVTRTIEYAPANNRLFILKEQLKEENETIDIKNLLNTERQYQDEGTIVNLFGYIDDLFTGQDTLTELFPGWTEDGKLVPWYYEITAGRHILEPADMVPVSEDYTVQVQHVWMSDDYQVDNQYSNLCYLQTLKNYKDGGSYKKLDVPDYIQAIRVDEDTSLKVEELKIPSTVLYIELSDSGLEVENGYEISEDNLFYSATDDGVLMNKAATKMIGIPTKIRKIEIPDTVESVVVLKKNQLSSIRVHASTIEDFPQIDYTNLENCTVIVDEALLDEVLQDESKYFNASTGNCVAVSGDEQTTYTVDNGMIVDNNKWVRKVLRSGNSIKLPKTVEGIQEGAFADAADANALIMPENGKSVKLQEGCFEESSLNKILCYTQKQYEQMKDEVAKLSDADQIAVELLETSKEGFTYCSTEVDGAIRNILIAAPKKITFYDGTVTSKKGELVLIHEIGDQAFAECDKLQWAELPEETDTIGYEAFAGCSSMEGLLINNKDTITIGNQALDGCTALRFAASNAMYAVMKDDYEVMSSEEHGAGSDKNSYFYIPTDAEGYVGYCENFTVESNVTGYAMTEIGGTRMLYGTNDEQGLWLALRSGISVEEKVTLPNTTVEIFQYAMANTTSESGSYTVNWEELSEFFALDDGAFYQSDLAGDLNFHGDYMFYLLTSSLADCPNITSVTVDAYQTQLGQFIFEGDSALKRVEFNMTTTMSAGTFNYCDNLEEISFDSTTPTELSIYGAGSYQFNYSWTVEEEAEKLSIHVPEDVEGDYIKKWRYLFAGYYDFGGESAYQRLWSDLESALIDWDTGTMPAEEEVDAFVESVLLKHENRIRKMMGVEEVTEPTEFYPYRVDGDGNITLIGASGNIEDAFLWGDEVGLPNGWMLDYIGSGAFGKCKNLQSVWIMEALQGIYENAFKGVESDELKLYVWSSEPIKLMGVTEGKPFDFGVDYDKLRLVVLGGETVAEDYLEAWKYPMAGYEDEEHMKAAIYAELSADGTEPTDEEVQAEMEERLKPVEEQFRAILEVPEDETGDTDQPGKDDQEEPGNDAGVDIPENGNTDETITGDDTADAEKKEDALPEKNASANEEIKPGEEQTSSKNKDEEQTGTIEEDTEEK